MCCALGEAHKQRRAVGSSFGCFKHAVYCRNGTAELAERLVPSEVSLQIFRRSPIILQCTKMVNFFHLPSFGIHTTPADSTASPKQKHSG